MKHLLAVIATAYLKDRHPDLLQESTERD